MTSTSALGVAGYLYEYSAASTSKREHPRVVRTNNPLVRGTVGSSKRTSSAP